MIYDLLNADSCRRAVSKLYEGGDAVGWDEGMSKRRAIWCIFFCLAFNLPLVKRCFAAMHRMWSSNINLAESRGIRLAAPDDSG